MLACAAEGSGLSTDRAGPDASHECDTDSECGGLACRYVAGTRQCVDPGAVPRGDGTECGDCPAPGECRMGECVQPDPSGSVCEFDPECGEDLCIAGYCTPDPRIPQDCGGGVPCANGLMCSMDGTCVCGSTVDCPSGLACVGGVCTPGDGCVADAECPSGRFCQAGRCIDGSLCTVVHPDLAGTWLFESELRLREALPGWLDSFLGAVAGPFHFIAGHTMTLGLGLPSWVESIIAPAIRSWADANLPPWARQLLGAVADLNDVLNTWWIKEDVTLTHSTGFDAYSGTHQWKWIEFNWRGMPVRGRPEDVTDWRFEPNDFDADAICGTLFIHRHDLDVNIGGIIAWAVDAIVFESTAGRYNTLMDALNAATVGFCDGLASAADGAVSYPGVYAATRAACNSHLSDLTNRLVSAINDARLGLDLVTIRGHAPIVDDRNMRPGIWEGRLAGGDFSGDFVATR